MYPHFNQLKFLLSLKQEILGLGSSLRHSDYISGWGAVFLKPPGASSHSWHVCCLAPPAGAGTGVLPMGWTSSSKHQNLAGTGL